MLLAEVVVRYILQPRGYNGLQMIHIDTPITMLL